MGCGGCNQRRKDLGAALRAATSGDLQTVSSKLSEVRRTFGEDAATVTRTVSQKLAAAHARLKR